MNIEWLGYSLVAIGILLASQPLLSPAGWILIAAGWVALRIGRRQLFIRTPLDWPVMLFIVMAVVTLLVTADLRASAIRVSRFGAGLVALYALASWADEKRRVRLVALGLIALGAAMALVAPIIVDWLATPAKFIPDDVYQYFPLLVFDTVHPNIIASVMVVLMPLSLAMLASPGRFFNYGKLRSIETVFTGGAFLIMGIVLILTKSRGGYLAGAVGVVVAMWLIGQRRLGVLAVLLAIAVGMVVNSAANNTGASNPAQDTLNQGFDPGTLAFRLRVWGTALQMSADFPFTGVGMGTFNDVGERLYPFEPGNTLGAHNLFLQVAADLGLPGMIAFLATILLAYWMAIDTHKTFSASKDLPLRGVTAGLIAGLTALSIHGLVDNTNWGTRADFVSWLVLGLIVASFRLAQSHNEPDDGVEPETASTY